MGLKTEVDQVFLANVASGNIVSLVSLTDTPASGAPGAYAKMLANAGMPVWWLTGFNYGNLSAAGATVFDYDIAQFEDGAGDINLATVRLYVEIGGAALNGHIPFPYPIRSPALRGAAAQQVTASAKTLDCSLNYATNVGA